MATPDPELQRRILDETVKRIPGLKLDRSPAVLSQMVYELTASITGNPDPYRAIKRDQNERALRLEPRLRAMVAESDDPLVTALHLAGAGNVIDLGVQQAGGIDVQATIEQVMRERFAVDHTEAFKESLAGSRDLLYLLDNAGEIVFDKVLIDELAKHTQVTAVVKAAPIINDALREDAEQVGITGMCEVIDNGGGFVGSPLEMISDAFRTRLDQAGMVLGKGQGNYETLNEYPGDVFFVLKAKCESIARHMGVQYGQVALISSRVRRRERAETA